MWRQIGVPLSENVVQQVGRRFHVIPVLLDEFFKLGFEKLLQINGRLVYVLLFVVVKDGVVEHQTDIAVEIGQTQVMPRHDALPHEAQIHRVLDNVGIVRQVLAKLCDGTIEHVLIAPVISQPAHDRGHGVGEDVALRPRRYNVLHELAVSHGD